MDSVAWQTNYISEAKPGGGKTGLLIGAAILGHQKAIIFRRTFPQLREVESQLREFTGGRGKFNTQEHTMKFGAGKFIRLGSVQHEQDWEDFQGQPHDYVGFDEGPQFPYATFSKLIAWNRSRNPKQRCRIIITGNPPTDTQGRWIIDRFGPWIQKKHPLYPTPAGKLLWVITPDGVDEWVSGPGEYERNGKTYTALSRTFIPAELDTALVGNQYRARLENTPEPLRSQLLLGDFEAGLADDSWQLFPSAWLQAAIDRGIARKNDDHGRLLSVGIDVARGGQDRTALARLYADNWYDEIIAVPGKGTPSGADIERILTESIKTRLQDDPEINWDAIGVGSGASEYLSRLWKNPNPISVDGSSYGYDKSGRYQFQNLKAEIFWKFREALDPDSGSNVCLPDDREMFTEFTAHRWDISPTGQIRIGKKDDIKSKIGRSPDKAEAVLLAWFSRTRVKFGAAWG